MKRLIILFISIAFTAVPLFAQTAQALVEEGQKLKKDGKVTEAMEKFKAALAIKKDYTEAIYEMGWCYNDKKEYTKALSNLREARKVWHDYAKVHFELGYAFKNLSMYDSAIASFNRCIAIKPDYSGVYKQLGYVAYDRDRYTEALEYFNKHIQNTKTEITDYLFWYRKGYVENAEKKHSDAVTSLKKALDLKKDYVNIYLELGYAYSRLKMNDESISWYNKAIEMDPKSHIGYNGIGEVYRDNIKDMDKAKTWYEKSLTVKPDERKACFGLGYIYNSKGEYQTAINYLQKAIAQEATYTAAFVELGYSYYMTKMNTQALEQFSKALALNPKNENARYYSGLVYINQGNRSKAQQMVDELKSLSSKNADKLQEKVNKM